MTKSQRGETDRDWLSVHLFHQGSLDLMLKELVSPMIRELRTRGDLAGFFFLRYWSGGPHIRLRVLPAGGRDPEAIRRMLEQSAVAFFAAHPSVEVLTSTTYNEMAAVMRRAEPDVEVMDLQSNDSIQFMAYRPEHHKYGAGEALAAVERHFEQASDLVLSVICGGVPLVRRRLLAFAAVVAAAAADTQDLEELTAKVDRGHRALVDIAAFSVGEDQRARGSYRQRERQLRTLALGMWRRPRPLTGDPFVDGWGCSVDRLASELHLASLDRGVAAVAIDNCAHLVCNRLGIGLRDECWVRALAACAVVDLRDRRQGVGAQQPSRAGDRAVEDDGTICPS